MLSRKLVHKREVCVNMYNNKIDIWLNKYYKLSVEFNISIKVTDYIISNMNLLYHS